MSRSRVFATGRVMVKLTEPKASAPAHLDVIAGAARPSYTLDGGGPVDRCVHACCNAMRVRRVFHARCSFGNMGEQGTGFADDEREIGLDRVYALEISHPEAASELVRDLRELAAVEWAMTELLTWAPMAARDPREPEKPDREAIEAPHRMVRAAEAHELEPGSAAVVVAVVDTGVALDHSEFFDRIYGVYDTVDLGMGRIGDDIELVGDSRGRDFAPRDETGHGSHVAGIMAANGLRVPEGVAGMARLAAVRALAAARGPDGKIVGVGGTLDIDAAIKAATELGARVINMSFGTPEQALDDGAEPVHQDAITYALSRGTIPVAAIGNSGVRERFFPAALEGVIAVGSVDHEGRHSEFSTTGDHCALAAPGEEIVSVGLVGYRTSTGTSHAAPFVSGAAALMLARADRAGVTLDSATARDILQDSATQQEGDLPEEVGAGILDTAQAIRLTDAHIAAQRGDLHE